MIVVSDTTPLHYLILIDHVDVLPTLFGEIVIPTGVLGELRHANTPEAVRVWTEAAPPCLVVRSPTQVNPGISLGHGEAEAITLAIEIAADLLLMDDRRARREAESRGLSVVGTLSVLETAARRGLLSLPVAVDKLQRTNFHVSRDVIQRVLATDIERRAEDE